MCCGIIEEARNALRAAFVCTTIYAAVESTGYTNDIHTNTHHKTQQCHKLHINYDTCVWAMCRGRHRVENWVGEVQARGGGGAGWGGLGATMVQMFSYALEEPACVCPSRE